MSKRPVTAAAMAVLLAVASGCGGRPAAGPIGSVGSVGSAPAASAAPTSPGLASPTASAAGSRTGGVPRFDHIVIAVVENHSFDEVLTSGQAPFLRGLAADGAVLTASYAVTHPSQPNYLALFSGSTQGLTDDSCPHSFTGPNLASELAAAGLGFTGYSESLPSTGYTACSAGAYARKHNPWSDFPALPAATNRSSDALPADPGSLPAVSFVVPDLTHDMHDGSVAAADRWLADHLASYAAWAAGHNSLLVVTADEDDTAHDNRIPTVLVGAHVRPGRYDQHLDHYGLLRTITDSFGLPPLGHSATAAPLSAPWTG